METHAEFLSHSVSPPIFLSSTWQKRTGQHANRTQYSYSRNRNPNFSMLETAINKIYGSTETVLACSGMAAISMILNTVYQAESESRAKAQAQGDPTNPETSKSMVFLADTELYSGTTKLLKEMPRFHSDLMVEFVDLTNPSAVQAAFTVFGSRIRLVFSESCSNPSGRLINSRWLVETYRPVSNFILVIDNSWLSSLYNPFNYGADLVMESLSKYMGGGDVIAGMVCGRNKEIMTALRQYAHHNGIRMSPFDAHVVMKSLETLKFKMHQVSQSALVVAKWLATSPVVSHVCYPMLPNSPSYELAQKLLVHGGPGILFFHVPLPLGQAQKMMDSSPIILYATSYGKAETLFDPYPIMGKSDDHPNPIKPGVCGTWIRLALGFASEPQEIIHELKRLFDKFIKP